MKTRANQAETTHAAFGTDKVAPVLVVGSVGLDTIAGPSGRFEGVLGGAAVYASIAITLPNPGEGAAPARPHLVGVVGRDFPDRHVQLLREKGVELSGLRICEGKTFAWSGKYNDVFTARETLRTDLHVFADFDPVIPERLRSIRHVLLGNIDPELQLRVLDQLRDPALVVTDTMNFWIEGKREALMRVLARTDVFVLNDEEARQLTGAYAMQSVADALLAMGPRIVVIKQGEYGALLFRREANPVVAQRGGHAHREVFSVPALPLRKVVDPTGAGDSFAGGFIGFLAQQGWVPPVPDGVVADADKDDAWSHALRRAMVFGTATASICVEGAGTDALASAEAAEVLRRYGQVIALSHIDVPFPHACVTKGF